MIMRKKIFMLLLLLFMTTGCSIDYELSIKDGKYEEKINSIETNQIYFDNNNDNVVPARELKDFYLKQPIPLSKSTTVLDDGMGKLENANYYSVSDISNDKQIGLHFNGTFDSKSYSNSSMINYGYNRFLKATMNGNTILSTGEKLKLFEQYSNLENVNVKITTDYNVVKHNADKVDGNTYIWKVNQKNYKDKSIYFEFNSSVDEESSFSGWLWIILFSIILIGLLIALIIIRKKNKENNSI